MRAKLLFASAAGALVLAACGGASTATVGDSDAGAAVGAVASAEDYAATATDFACLGTWTQVRKMRITNPRSDALKAEAIAVAQRDDGESYPVGTIVQIIPTHAMVKRREGFNPHGNDWEFFVLDVSTAGTTIAQRGGAEVSAPKIGSCQNCHQRARPFDFLCEEDHGCKSNGHTPAELMAMQAEDPRCQ